MTAEDDLNELDTVNVTFHEPENSDLAAPWEVITVQDSGSGSVGSCFVRATVDAGSDTVAEVEARVMKGTVTGTVSRVGTTALTKSGTHWVGSVNVDSDVTGGTKTSDLKFATVVLWPGIQGEMETEWQQNHNCFVKVHKHNS